MKNKIITFAQLHILFMAYSIGGIFSKFAAASETLSLRFCFFYGLVLLDLAVYAVFWQQVIKKMPLVTAYANKAVTVLWGMAWGVLVFGEHISVWNGLGAVVIMAGIYLVITDKEMGH